MKIESKSMKDINVLIIGNGNDNHIVRFLTNLKKKLPEVKIDFYDYGNNKKAKCKDLCEHIYGPSPFFHFIHRVLNKLFKIKFGIYLSYWFGFYRLKKHYDIANIHFVMPNLLWSMKIIKKKCKNLVLTPWGSDVLRQNENAIKILQLIYNKSDYVTAPITGFRNKVKEIFNISEDKFYDTAFGSDMIDLIAANNDLSKLEAKSKLGFDGKFIITVGYNANPAHHHIEIIEQINKVRNKLPENLLIVLPMSYYVTSKQHIIDVKELLHKYNLEYYCFENYVSNEELLLLRKCSDVFIHAQTTDAASASLTEYLLTDNIVLNASWLAYPQLEQYGIPYYKFDTLDEIGNLLVYAITNPTEHTTNQSLKKYIKTLGWDSCSNKWADFYRTIANQ